MSEDSNIQFLNLEGVNVTERITNGITFKFKSKDLANEKAQELGTYVYDLFYYLGNKKGRVVKIYGYAVPK